MHLRDMVCCRSVSQRVAHPHMPHRSVHQGLMWKRAHVCLEMIPTSVSRGMDKQATREGICMKGHRGTAKVKRPRQAQPRGRVLAQRRECRKVDAGTEGLSAWSLPSAESGMTGACADGRRSYRGSSAAAKFVQGSLCTGGTSRSARGPRRVLAILFFLI